MRTGILDESQKQRDLELHKLTGVPYEEIAGRQTYAIGGYDCNKEPKTEAECVSLYEMENKCLDFTGYLKQLMYVAIYERGETLIQLLKNTRNQVCLDFGSGVGTHAIALLENKNTVDILDVNGPLLSFAVKRIRSRGLELGHTYSNKSQLPEGKYDLIICTDVLEHVFDPMKELDKMRVALKRGGKLFLKVSRTIRMSSGHFSHSIKEWQAKSTNYLSKYFNRKDGVYIKRDTAREGKMIQIALLHDRYNWDSYSLVRSMHDILTERKDVEYLNAKNMNDMQSGSYLLLYNSNFILVEDDYLKMKARGVNVVDFGLSDPNFFTESRLGNCDFYCTNDLNTYRKYSCNNPFKCKVYHWQPGCYLEKFTKRHIDKDIDVLFIGTLSHGYIPMRKQYIMKLREEIPGFKGYGNGFDRFLTGEDLVSAYNRAHLNIDVVTKISSLSNSRLLQSAACGIPTLILKREDVLEEFEDGKEILTYTGGYDEMISAIKEALKDKDRLAEIGENARLRCIRDHGMRKRVDELIKYLGEKE